MAKYLNANGVRLLVETLMESIKGAFAKKGDAVKNIERNGTTFTATRADGTTFTFTQQDNSVEKSSTTPLEDGVAAVGSENKYAAGNHVHPHDSTKVDKVDGKGLSTNDYTSEEKEKLGDLPTGSELIDVLNGKVNKVSGKGLSSNDYTSEEKSKLGSLPTSADLTSSLGNKVDKVAGKGLSTNDYTTEEKDKLGSLPTSASLVASLSTKVDKETGKGLSSNDFTSAYKEKLDGLDDSYEGKMYFSQSGPVVLFDDGADGKPILEMQIGIDLVQEGSGNPSPSNVRPISGWTGANIYVSPTDDPTDGRTYSVEFPTEAGTVYGGVLDLTAGVLRVTHRAQEISASSVRDYGTTSGGVKYVRTIGMTGIAPTGDVFSDRYKGNRTTGRPSGQIGIQAGGNTYIYDDRFTSRATAEQILDTETPVIIYPLANPVEYALTAVLIAAVEGLNNVWANCGNILNLEYINASGWKLLKGAENKPATTSKAGLMSAEDKEKLDSMTPLRMNNGVLEYFDGSAWTAVPLGQ